MQRKSELGTLTFGLLLMAGVMGTLDAPQAIPSAGPERPGQLPPPGSDSATSEPHVTTDATAPDSGVERDQDLTPGRAPPESPPADVLQFVHRLLVRNGSTGGQGSCTHVGDGVYLTCRHVLDRQVSGVEIDGQQLAARWTVANGPDFSVVRASGSGPAARINTDELTDGQTLRIVGQKTGLHAGTLSATRWSQGYRAVVCDVPTESGDSGAGVFNDAGELVGVHWGSTGNEVFFTPLSNVAALVAPFTPAAEAHHPTAPGADTDVCRCLGHRRDNCHCLARGVACKCNATTGSVWEMDDGRPVRKTGAYADPRATEVAVETGYECTLRSDGRWYWHDGEQWRHTRNQPRDGMRFTGDGKSFVFSGGRMQDVPPRMAVEIKPRSGHWETRCFGGYCRQVWVEDR